MSPQPQPQPPTYDGSNDGNGNMSTNKDDGNGKYFQQLAMFSKQKRKIRNCYTCMVVFGYVGTSLSCQEKHQSVRCLLDT